ncbi:hypothetical protein NKG94_02015 [Micromonospora sp. M12]
MAALTDEALLARLNRPFLPYYEDVLIPRLAAGGHQVIGISVTYQWQLPFALWIARLVRRACPDVFLIAGGTEISDVWKCASKPEYVFQVLADFDAIVVGRESAYTDILDAVQTGTLPAGHPTSGCTRSTAASVSCPALRTPGAGARTGLLRPALGPLPQPGAVRLLFADPRLLLEQVHVLRLRPEHRRPDQPMAAGHCGHYGRRRHRAVEVRQVHLLLGRRARPATILRFAEKVVERGLDFRWGAEIRLEKYWSDERCELLRRSGCVAISVGFESGNQRILDLIDKGTKPEQVRRTMTSMTKANIGVQMMGFTGFPPRPAKRRWTASPSCGRTRTCGPSAGSATSC